MRKQNKIINREISWLSFNERVLQEAQDTDVPLIERIRFLGIFSNNLDEFFKVRVATIKRMLDIQIGSKSVEGEKPNQLMNKIQKMVIRLQNKFEFTFQDILMELEKEDIYITNEKELNSSQEIYVKKYFTENVLPFLSPIMLQNVDKFPYLKDKSIYLATKLTSSNPAMEKEYAIIEVPTDILPRFVIIPSENPRKFIILLEDIIRYSLKDLFSILRFDAYEAWIIKLTRDAELDMDNDVSKSFLELISKGVSGRISGQPVRFVFDNRIAKDLMETIIERLSLEEDDNLIPGGRYHNFKDFISFPNVGGNHLVYKKDIPVRHYLIDDNKSIMEVVARKDLMVHAPYQDFNIFISLLQQASIDPYVKEISLTVYRVARNSKVMNSFNYSCVSTGNFHEGNAAVYSDLILFTSDKRITSEVKRVFNFFANTYKNYTYRYLIASPLNMRKKMYALIDNEIKNAKAGKKAYIIIKINNLVDKDIIYRLYQANNAGVKIKLIIRGICSLIPGIEGMSENITAISIVDKYLEHSRILIFCNGGNELYFITSADLMARNLDRRIEITCPIYDKEIQQELKDLINIQLKDNVKARIINEEQDNTYLKSNSRKKRRSQVELYKYYSKKLKE